MLPIIEMMVPKGAKWRPAHPMTPSWITIHETGNPSKGSGAIAHGKLLQSKTRTDITAWHFTVDDQTIVQHLPIIENCWHAGDGTNGIGNRQSIAIEICVNSDSNYLKAVQNTVDLVSFLMKETTIPLDRIVQHNHWNGKNCPMKMRSGSPISWVNFLKLIQEVKTEPIKKWTVQMGIFSLRGNAENYVNTLKIKGIDSTIVEKEV